MVKKPKLKLERQTWLDKMHIAIEGFDGVGKTTLGMKLAKEIDFLLVEKPLHYLFDDESDFSNYIRYRDYINEQSDNHALRAWFYGLGNLYLDHKFHGKNIITVRHLISNYIWCGIDNTEPIFDVLVELIGKPSITILLFANQEVITNRLQKRNPDDKDLQKVDFYIKSKGKIIGFLKKHDMPYEEIDTSELNEDVVLKKVLDILKMYDIIK